MRIKPEDMHLIMTEAQSRSQTSHEPIEVAVAHVAFEHALKKVRAGLEETLETANELCETLEGAISSTDVSKIMER